MVVVICYNERSMKIVNEYPPNYDEICKVLKPGTGAIFCWGDIIYNPSGWEIPIDLQHHESIHEKQQDGNPEAWWIKYLYDRSFRLGQELEAYAEQLKFVKAKIPKFTKDALKEFASILSSEMYNLGITYWEAETLIRHRVKGYAKKEE